MRAVGVRLGGRLAGRDAEADLLAQVVRAGAAGEPRAVVVRGEAGVGKTRLVRDVCDDPGLLVLWGSCVHFGGASLPYAPIIGLLQDWLADADEAERAEVLAGADELSTLLPTLGTTRVSATVRLIPLIDLVLDRIAQRHPVVVVIDDLHWADMSSLDVLSYLITCFHGQRLTLLATCRDEDLGEGHPLHSWLADMRRTPAFDEIHLDRLGPDATGVQLEHLFGRPVDIDLVTQVQARSDGNPYLTELLAGQLSGAESSLPATVPEALRDALLAAWHRLSGPARQLVRVLAVGGRPTPLPLLAAVASEHGVDAATLSGCVSEAEQHGVLRSGSVDLPWFRHPVLAEVLYDALPRDEAALIHATYLRELEARSVPVEAAAADLAVHSQQAGRIADTYRWSLMAAEYAARLRAPAEQAIQLERLCALWEHVPPDVRGLVDRTTLALQTSEVCLRVGRNDAALEQLDTGLGLVDRERDPLIAANLLVERSILSWHRTEPIEAVLADIYEALDLTAAFPASAERARALSALGSAESWSGKPGAIAHADEAVRIAGLAGSERALAEAFAERSSVILDESPLLALADAQRAESLARSCGSMLDLLNAFVWQANALRTLGRRKDAIEVALRGQAELLAPGPDPFAYFLAFMAADGLLESGRWRACDDLLRPALAARSHSIAGAAIRLTAASLAVRQGRVPEARQHLDRARELISTTFIGIRAALAIGGSEVLAAEGKPREALDWLRSRLTRPGAAPDEDDDTLLVHYVHTAADLALAARDTRDARDADGVAAAVAAAEEVVNGWPWESFTTGPDRVFHLMNQALVQAELARCRDDPDQVERWQRAAEACDAAGVPWYRAISQWRCAEAAAAGRPAVSVGALLRDAHRCAVDLGAKPLQDEVESLARRSRVSLREPEPLVVREQAATPLSTLTAREREVLTLLVAGRSNGEIAKELVITDKTVSAHVSNILRKTGTSSRMAAAALATRLGGPGG
ncbi:helix-turn-helix transcriptional regulator [Kribbella sp. NBC_00359]|uniref:helix-turn-helix transcriptional regulator n=1 Tax=Kribbella sp. NBC_00359 TaxID=2975966 RepID=UPI002E1BDF8B